MKSRRAMVARNTPHLLEPTREKSRKAYTGDHPITGEEWKLARISFGYSQVVFAHYFSVHPNTVAKRERDEQDFAHPRLARLAIQQHRLEIEAGQVSYDDSPIKGAEWLAYINGLEMNTEQFGREIDAHPITVSKWLKDEVEFPHPNMARLAIKFLYSLRGIPFDSVRVKGRTSLALF